MKKLILAAAVAFAMAACTKNGEQIDAAKGKLNEIGMTYVNDLEFEATEVSAADVYKKIAAKYQKQSDDLKELGDYTNALARMKEAGTYIDKIEANKDKRYYIVNGHQVVSGDTLHKVIVYVDDTNKVLDFENLK